MKTHSIKYSVLRMMVVLQFLIMIPAWGFASPFDEQDNEAKDVAFFVRHLLGHTWEQDVLRDYPGSTIDWGARVYEYGAEGAGWLVYAEVKPQFGEPVYYLYRIRIEPLDKTEELLIGKTQQVGS